MDNKGEEFILGVFCGLLILLLVFALLEYDKVFLSQETARDVCIILTNNTAAVGSQGENNKLVCTIPSYDSTTNIIVKNSAGEIVK